MLNQIWTKIKDFWFSFGEQEPDDYFYLKNGSVKWFRSVKPDVELTHREIQQLRSLIRKMIKFSEDDLKTWKKFQGKKWNLCDPSNPETAEEFEALNFWNDMLRDEQTNLKKLVNLQTKLKRLKGI